jgi:hypothetical protein
LVADSGSKNAADLKAGGGRRAQGRCLSQLLRFSASEGEQSLGVLARGDQQSFYVHPLELPRLEPSHPVPIFGLGEQRLYPPLLFRRAFS